MEPVKDKKKSKDSKKDDDRKGASLKRTTTKASALDKSPSKIPSSPTKLPSSSGRKSPGSLAATQKQEDPPSEDTGKDPEAFKSVKRTNNTIPALALLESEDVVPAIPENLGSELASDEEIIHVEPESIQITPPVEEVVQQ